jgi:NADH dehydrogenase FAD-containing subunit
MREIDDFGASASTTTEVGCFPVKNATTPYWRSQLHTIDQHRSTEELPTECDVAIIGSGMAGVSIAHHVTKHLKEGEAAPSIVLLEARQVCSGATGRNGVRKLPSCL